MLQFGNLKLHSRVLCAPMAGCTNLTWRRALKRYNPGLIYCEMVKMEALVRADPNTYHLLDYETNMHPIGAQLCGSNPKIAAQAARMVEELGFDVVDLNCGCPVDKVTKDGSGSGMLQRPELIAEVLHEMCNAVKIPVTLKIRAGWCEESINGPEIVELAEATGAKAVAIHGRTRAQAYKGSANWDWIKACKARAKEIAIIANGDINDVDSALAAFEQTGADAILLARGLLGRPWLIEDIERALNGLKPITRTPSDYQQMLLDHLDDIDAYASDRKALIELRRIGCWYLKKNHGAKALRDQLNKAPSTQEAHTIIESFDWSELMLEDQLCLSSV